MGKLTSSLLTIKNSLVCSLKSHSWMRNEGGSLVCKRCNKNIIKRDLNVRNGDAEDDFLTEDYYPAWLLRVISSPDVWLKVFSIRVLVPLIIVVGSILVVVLYVLLFFSFLSSGEVKFALTTAVLVFTFRKWFKDFSTGLLESLKDLFALWERLRFLLSDLCGETKARLISVFIYATLCWLAVSYGLALYGSEEFKSFIPIPLDRQLNLSVPTKLAGVTSVFFFCLIQIIIEVYPLFRKGSRLYSFKRIEAPLHLTMPHVAGIAHLSDLHIVGEKYDD